MLRTISLLCLFFLLGCAFAQSQELNVAFTGSLSGYYRTPLCVGSTPCPSGDMTPVANLKRDVLSVPYLGATRRVREVPTLLLGMGNNFGPEFGSSIEVKSLGQRKGTLGFPVGYYKGLTEMARLDHEQLLIADEANDDNVARVLMDLGYSALTPGPDDFIYGGVWLKRLGDLLKTAPPDVNKKGTQLIAANLIATFPSRKAKPVSPCPLLFSDIQDKQGKPRPTWEVASCDPNAAPVDYSGGFRLVDLSTSKGAAGQALLVGVVDQKMLTHIAKKHTTSIWPVLDVRQNNAHVWEDVIYEDSIDIATIEPVTAVFGAIAAARRSKDWHDVREIIVMAQMPHTDAEVLAARVQAKLNGCSQDINHCKDLFGLSISLVISQAEASFATPEGVQIFGEGGNVHPVYTPNPGYQRGADDPLVDPLNVVRIKRFRDGVANFELRAPRQPLHLDGTPMSQLLGALVNPYLQHSVRCGSATLDCQDQVKGFLLDAIRRRGNADVGALQGRDFFLGILPKEYDETKNCMDQLCKLTTMLDTALWRGDYFRGVLVSGKELRSYKKQSDGLRDQRSSLSLVETQGEWLDLSGLREPNEPKTLLKEMNPCVDEGDKTSPTLCTDRGPIRDDDSYWVATSDGVFDGSALFQPASLSSSGTKALSEEEGTYLTTELATYLSGAKTWGGPAVADGNPEIVSHSIGGPARRTYELDIAKIAVGFLTNGSSHGDDVADSFSGVQDARAAQLFTHQEDFEGKVRALYRPTLNFALGTDVNGALNTTRTGGTAAHSKQVTWGANTLSAGGLIQYDLFPRWTKLQKAGLLTLSRFAVVGSVEYTRNIQAAMFYAKVEDAADATKTDPVQVAIEPSHGWNIKAGLRLEAGHEAWWQLSPETYMEFGYQASTTGHLFSTIYVDDPGKQNPPACAADVSKTLATCLKTVVGTAKSILTPDYTDGLRTQGLYWDIHWKKTITNLLSITADSLGSAALAPGAKTLSTETYYAIPLTVAFNLTVHSNFTLSPSYNAFYYETQSVDGSPRYSTYVRGFTVLMKYYFSKDTRVPFRRQFAYDGPKSADETGTAAKLK